MQVGRPILHGLALDGQQGVEAVLKCLQRELALNMALAGALCWLQCMNSAMLPEPYRRLVALHEHCMDPAELQELDDCWVHACWDITCAEAQRQVSRLWMLDWVSS